LIDCPPYSFESIIYFRRPIRHIFTDATPSRRLSPLISLNFSPDYFSLSPFLRAITMPHYACAAEICRCFAQQIHDTPSARAACRVAAYHAALPRDLRPVFQMTPPPIARTRGLSRFSDFSDVVAPFGTLSFVAVQLPERCRAATHR